MRNARGGVEEPTLSFPMLVTFGAAAVALLLFLTNTAPALREQRELERVEQQTRDQRDDYIQQLVNLRRRDNSQAVDVQELLISIDALGLTPAELMALHPEQRDATNDDTVDRQQLRHVRGN